MSNAAGSVQALLHADVRQRPRRGSRSLSWVVVLAVELFLFECTRRGILITGNPRLLPAMVLFGTLAVPVSFLTFMWGRQMQHNVTAATAMVVATVGGCLSVVAAALLENAALHGSTIGPVGQLPLLAVGVIEEGSKLLMTMVVLLSVLPRTPLNGLLVGVATGTGFAVLETLGYEFVAYVQQGGLPALDSDLVTRSLFAPATHIAWAGVTGCAFGYAASQRWRARPVLLCLTIFAGVALLHTAWDRDPGPGTQLGLTLLGLGLLTTAVRLTGGKVAHSVAQRSPQRRGSSTAG